MTEESPSAEELSSENDLSPDTNPEHEQFQKRREELKALQELICAKVCQIMPSSTMEQKKAVAKKTLRLALTERMEIEDAINLFLEETN